MMTATALPSPTALAHAIRYDGFTADELALQHATTRQRIVEHLAAGGFDPTGYKHAGQVNGQHKRRRLKDADNGYGRHVSGADRTISTEPARYRGNGRPKTTGLDWEAHRAPEPVQPAPARSRPVQTGGAGKREGEARNPAPQADSKTRCRWCRERVDAEDLVDDMCPLCRADAAAQFVAPTQAPTADDIDSEEIPADVAPEPTVDASGVPRVRTGGCSNRPGSLERHAEDICRRYQDGETVSDIAQAYGASDPGVSALLRRHKVKMRTRSEAIRLGKARKAARRPAGVTGQKVSSTGHQMSGHTPNEGDTHQVCASERQDPFLRGPADPDSPEDIAARQQAILDAVPYPRGPRPAPVQPPLEDADGGQVTDGDGSGEIRAETEKQSSTAEPEPTPAGVADATQMQPVDANESSNDDANATPGPGLEPANVASRAKSTGHSHGNGTSCRSLHARQFDATAALLLRGRQSDYKRTQKLAQRISDLLIDLRDRLDEEDDTRRQRLEEERKLEEAKAEVKRLEAELREARARARGHNRGYARTTTVQKTEHPEKPAPIPADHPTNAGRRAGGKANSQQANYSAREVREWCKANGVCCPARGRFLPKDVLEKYFAANPERRTA